MRKISTVKFSEKPAEPAGDANIISMWHKSYNQDSINGRSGG